MPSKRKLKILVVDDDEFMAGIYILTLEKAGFEVVLKSDGVSGLKAAKKLKPDAIILDILMPGLDGYQVLKELKDSRVTRNIPVMMLTTLSQPEDRQMGIEGGADVFLTKTTTLPDDVLSKLNEIIKK